LSLPNHPVPLKRGDDIFLQDTVMTHAYARIEMVLGGKFDVAMRERSVLTLTEAPRRTVLGVETGTISISARRERMLPGEALDVRTPNGVASVRGTRIVVTVERFVFDVTHVDVLDGSVSVAALRAGTPAGAIDVVANQGITISGETAGPIRPLRTLSLS